VPSLDLSAEIKQAEKKLGKLNREFEQLKSRQFRARRGRNNRIFYRSMSKAIFDYDTQDDSQESPKVGEKRSRMSQASYLDKLMSSQQHMMEDIEKHCYSKRLKKSIFKLDCMRIGKHGSKLEQVTMTGSDSAKLPFQGIDPVISHDFVNRNSGNYQGIMQDQAEMLL